MKYTLLKELREEMKLTQKEMCQILGITRPTYIATEYGRRELNAREIRALAKKLGMNVEELVSGIRSKKNKDKSPLFKILQAHNMVALAIRDLEKIQKDLKKILDK